jgi:Pilus formation protein N terminal region
MACVSARVSAILFGLGMFAVASSQSAAADLTVILDQAQLLRLPERATTVVIGNPLIADVALQPGGQMVVTGKGYGVTNIIALDRAGAVLMERSIEVRGPREHVVVLYRGIERESYSCTPKCERLIMLGDSGVYFDTVIAQSGARNGSALGAPPAAAGASK